MESQMSFQGKKKIFPGENFQYKIFRVYLMLQNCLLPPPTLFFL